MNNSNLEPVSIVIPIKNRCYFIDNLIKNLSNLNYAQYEIIIVDDCSIDNTKELLKKYSIKAISLEKSVGSAEARNIGIKEAQYDIIALTDSDCFVSRNWLKDLVPFLNNYNVVGGRVTSYDSSETKLHPFNMKKEIIIEKESSMNFLNTSNMIFKKDLWKESGGFFNYRIEDLEFSWRLLRKGFKFIYVPRGLVIHIGIRNPLNNIKKYIQYGKAYSKLSFIYKMDLSFKTEKIFDKKSVWYYFQLIIYPFVFLITVLISFFMISNVILYFLLITFSLFFFIFLISLTMKKIDINYKLYKFCLLLSIIIYHIIYKFKK
ncbi:MAG: glycosyltransferase [Promethearchaeota archaeon]